MIEREESERKKEVDTQLLARLELYENTLLKNVKLSSRAAAGRFIGQELRRSSRQINERERTKDRRRKQDFHFDLQQRRGRSISFQGVLNVVVVVGTDSLLPHPLALSRFSPFTLFSQYIYYSGSMMYNGLNPVICIFRLPIGENVIRREAVFR